MPRSRSFTRLTMRVGLEHMGQSVLLLVSIAFLRSPVLAIFAMIQSPVADLLFPGGALAAVGRHIGPDLGSHDFSKWDESREEPRRETRLSLHDRSPRM